MKPSSGIKNKQKSLIIPKPVLVHVPPVTLTSPHSPFGWIIPVSLVSEPIQLFVFFLVLHFLVENS